jgi:hypothetical protein
MKRNLATLLGLLLVGSAPRPAFANAGPDFGPETLTMVLLPMMILTLLGEGYAIRAHLRGPEPARWYHVRDFADIAMFLSFPLAYGLIVTYMAPPFDYVGALGLALALGGLASYRGVLLVRWGWLARTASPPPYLAGARSWRLLPAGGLLLVATIFFTGPAVKYSVSYPAGDPMFRVRMGARVMQIVAYHFKNAREEGQNTGQKKYSRLQPTPWENLSEWQRSDFHKQGPIYTYGDDTAKPRWGVWVQGIHIEYTPDGQRFTVYYPPERVPFFPFNSFFPTPSFRADQTGQIRMCHVWTAGAFCPPDAPVLLWIGEAEAKEILTWRRDGGFSLREYFRKKVEEEARRKEAEKGPA